LNRTDILFRSIVCAALFSAVAATAQRPAATPAAPIPSAILSAHKIFLANAASDNGMFPSPFSGDADRAYNQFYAALKASGKYELVADPADADLVLELHLENAVNLATMQRPVPVSPVFRLMVYGQKSHFLLWESSEWIDFATLQKTHDRNFNQALTALRDDFLALTAPAPPPTQ
jgi:hypothetical protein